MAALAALPHPGQVPAVPYSARAACQTRRASSRANTRSPSHATAVTASPTPGSVSSSRPLATSHTCTRLSDDPVTSRAPFALVLPADDHYNATIIDAMVRTAETGCDIVCASRFMPGGSMVGCPWLKAMLVRGGNFTLRHLARLPTRDASNGFRLFSRRVVDDILIESDRGFCYSIELLVKAHRLGWRIGEVPANWFERTQGSSRFQIFKWLPVYLRWYRYAFATTYLMRSPRDVRMKAAVARQQE